MIFLITGQPGSGKTTLAMDLRHAGVVQFVVDGDLLRALDHPGYDREGRLQNVDRAHAIALYLNGMGYNVAVSLIQPYEHQRARMREKGAAVFSMTKHYGVRREYWVEDYESERDPDLIDPTVEDVVEWVGVNKKPPRATFIGRFQTFHDGHRWLIQQALDRGDPVLVLVRDTNERKDAREIAREIEREYFEKGQDVVAYVIPNVKSVEYGRDVGYQIIEHVPPDSIGEISGTKLRG